MKGTKRSLIAIGILVLVILVIVFFTGGDNSGDPTTVSFGGTDEGIVDKVVDDGGMGFRDINESFEEMDFENMSPSGDMGEPLGNGMMMDFDNGICDDLNEGDSCIVNFGDRSANGTCQLMNDELFCVPEMRSPDLQQ